MTTRLLTWLFAVLILFQNLVVYSSAQAATIQASPLSSIEAAKTENAKILQFSDSEAFYKELTEMVKSKTAASIKTPFKRYEDFPPRLKKVFQLKEVQQPLDAPIEGINSPTTESFPGAMGAVASVSRDVVIGTVSGVILSLNYGALVSAVTSIVTGAGVAGLSGSAVGGIGAVPGVLIGGGIGLAGWAIYQGISSNCYKVHLRVNRGCIELDLEPVCPFLP